MSKFVLGFTTLKGCVICGRDLFKVNNGQTLTLDGSKGKVAVCSQVCAGKYKPAEAETAAAAESAPKPEKKKKLKLK